MADVSCNAGALAETVAFLSQFKDLPDGRQKAKIRYPLDEVLLPCLLAVIAGAETITDISRFGEKKLNLLRRFRPFADGVPPMIIWVTSSPASMPSTSSAAL
ncbi:transposase family protein [Mesorhizobium ventifaucium]|uniref:H repeat-associated protein N-terminal domain-containing protein n=1 Tax=Mesorhizobium ventifaucium TaxID=666020 RepID=A0ABM9DF42_9HYPH|nr:transposase family protein [Mesorhizobium ventifaucium]CAH2394396.1 hypothetical protein MES4922_10309 [Mesorhizobium ventifaucium]